MIKFAILNGENDLLIKLFEEIKVIKSDLEL